MHSLRHTFSSIDILSIYEFLCMSFCLFSFYLLKVPCLFFVSLVVCCSFVLIFFCASLLQCWSRHFVDFFSSLMPNYFIANTICFSFFICVALHILFKLLSMFFRLLYYGFSTLPRMISYIEFFCIFLFLFILFLMCMLHVVTCVMPIVITLSYGVTCVIFYMAHYCLYGISYMQTIFLFCLFVNYMYMLPIYPLSTLVIQSPTYYHLGYFCNTYVLWVF